MKLMKKYILLIIILLSTILLTGCGNKYKAYSNYTESEVFELVNAYIKEETYESTKYDLEIIKTEPLEVCTFGINVCHEYTTVKGANKYTVELTNKTTGRKESQVIVEDKYYENNELIKPQVRDVSFISNHKYYIRHDKLINLLNNYKSIQYKLIDKNVTDETLIIQHGYIYSSNISELEDFLNTIVKKGYEYYWDFLITNDINEYNAMLNSSNNYSSILEKYEKKDVVYKVDLSSFNSSSTVIVENTSQGSSASVNTTYIKR